MCSLAVRADRVPDGSMPPRRSAARLARELTVVGLASVAVVTVAGLEPVRAAIPVRPASLVLALATAAFAAMGSILAALVGRLTHDHRLTCISRALALYSVVGVPASTISSLLAPGDPIADAARMAAYAVMVGLLLMAVWPPLRLTRLSSWSGVVLGLLVTVAAAWLASLDPVRTMAISSFPPARVLLGCGGVTAGVLLTVVGWRRGAPLGRVGMGVVVTALAHLDRAGAVEGWLGDPGLAFSALRQLGVALTLLGLAQLTYRSLRAVDESSTEHQEQLRRAKIDLDRFAERDHELRNGLAGLAGATGVLAGRTHGDKAELCSAVAAELARLDTLLSGEPPPEVTAVDYPLHPVLRDLVVLWRTRGMDIRLDAEPELWANGCPERLAQVVANVVANCARHAPGSPVRVQALRRGDRVRVRISDFGPGLRALSERVVFERRVRGERSAGQGLGLFISRKLLDENGGTIRMLPSRPARPGCTVVIELPMAASAMPAVSEAVSEAG
ncbi:sensor histidine kinase [Pseudonocardia acaciae]|uniref:sensor histidine kinase n=1 Tax=Pseudonocardia acaciae TaxID=551276 RepID=UPI00048B5394|nr:HAMP domain-containing sensor histidine kinase [Pseudonocardia acaciae]